MTRLLTSKYISVGVTYISWFSDFALYLEYFLLDKCHTWDITSMWPNEWPLTISRSLWPIFHGSVILPYILNTICWINVTPGILLPCDPMNDHLLYLGHCDLYTLQRRYNAVVGCHEHWPRYTWSALYWTWQPHPLAPLQFPPVIMRYYTLHVCYIVCSFFIYLFIYYFL